MCGYVKYLQVILDEKSLFQSFMSTTAITIENDVHMDKKKR